MPKDPADISQAEWDKATERIHKHGNELVKHGERLATIDDDVKELKGSGAAVRSAIVSSIIAAVVAWIAASLHK